MIDFLWNRLDNTDRSVFLRDNAKLQGEATTEDNIIELVSKRNTEKTIQEEEQEEKEDFQMEVEDGSEEDETRK
jgi:hypothetical protein